MAELAAVGMGAVWGWLLGPRRLHGLDRTLALLCAGAALLGAEVALLLGIRAAVVSVLAVAVTFTAYRAGRRALVARLVGRAADGHQ